LAGALGYLVNGFFHLLGRAGSKKGSGLGQPGYGLVEGGVIPGARHEENEPQGGEEGPRLPGKIYPPQAEALYHPDIGQKAPSTRGDGGSGKTPTTEISPPPLQLSARCSLRNLFSPRMKTRLMGDFPWEYSPFFLPLLHGRKCRDICPLDGVGGRGRVGMGKVNFWRLGGS